MPAALRFPSAVVLISLMLGALAASTTAAAPEFFSSKPYAQAQTQAQNEGKLFMVKATAVWCGPCKRMDRTTFKDQSVIDWLTEHAVSVSLDIDANQAKAKELGIRSVPTIILFKGDEELARVSGARAAPGFLAWLKQKAGDDERPPPPQPSPMQQRMMDALELTQSGEHEKAIAEHVWLWNNIADVEPSMQSVRASFLAANMEVLAGVSSDAFIAFEKLRDDAAQRAKKNPRSFDDLRDSLVLSERVLNDRASILAWVDGIKNRSNARSTYSRVSDIVGPALIDESEWALYGSLIDHPERTFSRSARLLKLDLDRLSNQRGSESEMMEARELVLKTFRKEASNMHAGLLASGRNKSAWEVAEIAIEHVDDAKTRSSLIRTAHRAGVLDRRHLELLDPDEPSHAPLIEQTNTLLEE